MNRRHILTLPLACALPIPEGVSALDRLVTIPSEGDPIVGWRHPVIEIRTDMDPKEVERVVRAALEDLIENSVYVLPRGTEARPVEA